MNGVTEGGPVTLDMLKQMMAQFAKERDWDRFHSPRNLLLALVSMLPLQYLIKKIDFFFVFIASLLHPCMNFVCFLYNFFEEYPFEFYLVFCNHWEGFFLLCLLRRKRVVGRVGRRSTFTVILIF